jgi:tetratricopeptide (TPR) repeat protein
MLGAFEVVLDGVMIPEDAWPRRKTRSLLKVLLTAPGDVFTVDQLIDALLPNANVERAAANIQARVSELRRVLEPSLSRGQNSQYIVSVGEGYAFNADASYWLDMEAFKEEVNRADSAFDQGDWAQAVEGFEEAVALYRGEFLPEDRYAEWSQSPRDQLQETYIEAYGRLATCYWELGRHRQAIRCCQRILAIAPHREGVIRQLMRCYAEVGERSKAIEAYDAGVRELRERLDVGPSPELRDLRDHIAVQTSRPESSAYDSRRIAVIPFVNVGPDPSNEFLADGMTEELIYTLSKVAGLEVIAQTTVLNYKGAQKSVAEIGQELRVGSLLEGSVQKVKDKARILVQLIDVESESHLWAEQYDRDMQDVLSVQGDIARRVAAALKVQLLAKEETAIRKGEASNPKARVAYLKGRLFLAKRTRDAYLKAIEYFEQALAIAPDYARALTGLADAYCLMVGFISASEGYEKAKIYTQQALVLDPSCAEAHATVGLIAWLNKGDVHEAESEFLRAIELNPNYALAHERYAGLLMHTGRVREACLRSENALTFDPLSATLNLTYAESLHGAGRLVEAVDQYEKALELNTALEDAWWGLWYSLAAQWDWDQAETVTSRCVERYPNNPFAHVNVAQCVMCRGRLEEGLVEIRKALDLAGNPKRTSILFHAGVSHYFGRQYDKAIEFFRQGLKRNPGLNSAHNMIAKCHIEQERYDEALEELDAAERMFGGADPFWNAHVHMDRGIIYARNGETEKAEKELEVLMRSSGRRNRRIAISGILNALGRVDEAIDWLEAAATAREPHVAALLKVPTFDRTRSHPRFQALLKRIGLTD